MKKFVIFSLIAFSVFFLAAPALHSHHTYAFPDVPVGHPYYAAMEYLRVRGVISGFHDGRYRPDQDIKRVELVAILLKAKRVNPSSSRYKNCYKDVKQQSFADEVCYAEAQGWIEAPGERFRPKDVATPVFAQTAIWRAFGLTNPGSFTDTLTGRVSRGLTAQWLYEAILRTGGLSTASTQTYSGPNPYTINVPAGYPTPWVPAGAVFTAPAPSSSSYYYYTPPGY